MSLDQDVTDSLIDRVLERLRRIKGEDSSTYVTYRRDLRTYDSWLNERGISAKCATTLDIENFVLTLKDYDYAGNTIETRYTAVRRLYSVAVDTFGTLNENPCNGVNLIELGVFDGEDADHRHYITEEEFDHMRENCGEPYVRNRLVLELFWQTGVRLGELRNIKLDKVNREKHPIEVWGQKTDERRTVHYQPSLNRLINIWIEEERPLLRDSPYFFPSNRAEQLSKRTFRRIVLDSAEEINEVIGHTKSGHPKRRITPHTMRHSHAVHALKSGVPVRAVQKQLGHADISTTMQYLRLIDDDVAEAYQAFE